MASGLEGVVVADTEMSHVDGEKGELWIRGQTVRQLARRGRLEVAIALLWGGAEQEWISALGAARARCWPVVAGHPALAQPDATASLRAVLAPLEGASHSGQLRTYRHRAIRLLTLGRSSRSASDAPRDG